MIHKLNFKHLRYFLVVAQEGSISRACERLNLTPQTISAQIKVLEETLEVELFHRRGRRLELTEAGKQTIGYAEQIFSTGEALQSHLRSVETSTQPFSVGIADVLPKQVAYRLLEPIFELDEPVRLECREGSMETLMADLTAHRVDMVLTDRPIDSSFHIRAYNHLLGECSTSLFAAPSLAKQYSVDFPTGLHNAPILMPTEDTVIGSNLRHWFQKSSIRPRIVVECVDNALLATFGQAGKGLFCGPTALQKEISNLYNVEPVGEISEIRERFYAISLERRISHPAVLAITNTARGILKQSNES